jgi:hypothetical protein
VPNGAVVIWRTDLVWAVAELLQLRAYRDHIKAARAARGHQSGVPTDAAGDAPAEIERVDLVEKGGTA